MADRDLDAEFERIIAGWDDEAPDPQRREPSTPASTPASTQTTTDAPAAESPVPDDTSDTASDGADPLTERPRRREIGDVEKTVVGNVHRGDATGSSPRPR